MRQLLDRPDIQPGHFHIHQRIRWFEKYPALHTLLIYRRCIDVVHYDNIKEIPSTSCFSQRQVDKVFKFIFNHAQNTRKGPPQVKRHGQRADPWSRSHQKPTKRHKPTQGGRSSYKQPQHDQSHQPPPNNHKSHHTPPRNENTHRKQSSGNQRSSHQTPPHQKPAHHNTPPPKPAKTWSFYPVLGIPKGSTIPQIKKAYSSKTLQHHPDKNIGKTRDEAQKELWNKILRAGKVLRDEKQKAEYDFDGDNDYWNTRLPMNPYIVNYIDRPGERWRG